jgi:hypothetical protein
MFVYYETFKRELKVVGSPRAFFFPSFFFQLRPRNPPKNPLRPCQFHQTCVLAGTEHKPPGDVLVVVVADHGLFCCAVQSWRCSACRAKQAWVGCHVSLCPNKGRSSSQTSVGFFACSCHSRLHRCRCNLRSHCRKVKEQVWTNIYAHTFTHTHTHTHTHTYSITLSPPYSITLSPLTH